MFQRPECFTSWLFKDRQFAWFFFCSFHPDVWCYLTRRVPACRSFVSIESYLWLYLKSNNKDIFFLSFSFHYIIVLVFLNYKANHNSRLDGNLLYTNYESKTSQICCNLTLSPNTHESYDPVTYAPYFLPLYLRRYEFMKEEKKEMSKKLNKEENKTRSKMVGLKVRLYVYELVKTK